MFSAMGFGSPSTWTSLSVEGITEVWLFGWCDFELRVAGAWLERELHRNEAGHEVGFTSLDGDSIAVVTLMTNRAT
jgi:hypothetical protein